MRYSFFNQNRSNLQFEWNSAIPSDWPKLRRNFVGAYLCSYINHTLADIHFSREFHDEASNIWLEAYQLSNSNGFELLQNAVIKPLQFYLFFIQKPLEQESNLLRTHFNWPQKDISLVKDEMIKLMILRNYFEALFFVEKQKIGLSNKKIDYLILRYKEQPIAFFTCELNYKSSFLYLRFINISPAFHRLGLAKIILDEISQHYPEALGMELYVRKDNSSAVAFYKQCGFRQFESFDFNEPEFQDVLSRTLHFPKDDATDRVEDYLAFAKPFHILKR